VKETIGINEKVKVNYNLIDSYKKINIEACNNVGSLNPFSTYQFTSRDNEIIKNYPILLGEIFFGDK
jgi:hypothetical protein